MKIFVCLIKSIEVIWYELCSGASVDELSNKNFYSLFSLFIFLNNLYLNK